MSYWSKNQLGAGIDLKKCEKLGGQRTNKRFNTVSVGGQTIHLMNEKAVSSRWIDRDKGILEVCYEPNEDGKIVKAVHLGPDQHQIVPADMSTEKFASSPGFQNQVQAGMKSRGGGAAQQQSQQRTEKRKSGKKGFFGLERWSVANIAVSCVMIPLWLAWKILLLGFVIEATKNNK